jgi:sugar O-acyltransferase (sialic acid O-acetyltransferase NeuD family)
LAKRLAIVGSGDLGQLIAHHASVDADFHVVGFFDDADQVGRRTAYGPILGRTSDCRSHFQGGAFDCFAFGIGYKHAGLRASLFKDLARSIPAATIVHSSCFVDRTAHVPPGAVLLPGCVLDKGVVLGENVLLNTACAIAHDTRVGNNCFLGPRVSLAGFIEIGESCFLGVSTTIIDRIKICAGVQTGGGAVVINNITEPGLYVGVPARRVR